MPTHPYACLPQTELSGKQIVNSHSAAMKAACALHALGLLDGCGYAIPRSPDSICSAPFITTEVYSSPDGFLKAAPCSAEVCWVGFRYSGDRSGEEVMDLIMSTIKQAEDI